MTLVQLGPAVKVRATANGQALTLQAIEQAGSPAEEVILRFPQARSERTIAIPDRSLVFRIVATGDQRFLVQGLDANSDMVGSQELEGPGVMRFDDIEVRLEPTHFVTLRVASRPWLWLLIPAGLITLVGLALRWRFPYVRWGWRSNEGGTTIRWQGQRGGRPRLAELVALLDLPPSEDPA